jgi:hypothetical protein
MSPEQARALPTLDHQCDLWSMADLNCATLTGRTPWPGDTMQDVLVNVCRSEYARLSVEKPDLGDAFDPFLARAFQRMAPVDRAQSPPKTSMTPQDPRVVSPSELPLVPSAQKAAGDAKPAGKGSTGSSKVGPTVQPTSPASTPTSARSAQPVSSPTSSPTSPTPATTKPHDPSAVL